MKNDVFKILTDNPAINSAVALLLTLFGLLYGPNDITRAGMTLVVLLIILDWITGLSAAKKDCIDTSSYGIDGLLRTIVLLLLPAIAHFMDLFFYTQGLVSYFMIAALARHLLKSVIANTYRAGWTQWVPTSALNKLLIWVSDEIAHKEARAKQRYDEIYGGDKDGLN